MTSLPRFMPDVWLTQEHFSALDSNYCNVLQPTAIRHAQHLTIQDSGVLGRGGPSIATEELVAWSIELSAASTRHRIDLLFPIKTTQSNLPPSTAIFRNNRRRGRRLIHEPTSARSFPPPDGALYPASLSTPALARRSGNNQGLRRRGDKRPLKIHFIVEW